MTSSEATLSILPKVAFSDGRNERLEWAAEHQSKLSTGNDVSAQIMYCRWSCIHVIDQNEHYSTELCTASHVDVRLMQCHSLTSTLCRQFLVLVEGLSSQHLRPACITLWRWWWPIECVQCAHVRMQSAVQYRVYILLALHPSPYDL